MEPNDLDQLEKLARDPESFDQLKEIVDNLVREREEKTRQLELLESAISGDYDAIVITEADIEKPGPRIVYVNDAFCKMTGYQREEVLGKTPRLLQGPKTDQEVLDKLRRRLADGQSFFGKTVNYRKDGSEFVNQWDVHPLTDKEGNITNWVSYQHDITERRRTKEWLMDSKVEFDNLREESRRTIVDIDRKGHIAMANKAFRELVGYQEEELEEIKIWDLLADKFTDTLKEHLEELDEEDLHNQVLKGIIHHKEDFPIQVRGKTRVLDLQDQQLVRIEIGNISLQKRIMNSLKKRNRDYSRLVEEASEFSYRITYEEDKPVVQSVSEAFPTVTGFSHRALLEGAGWENIIHIEDMKKFLKHLRTVYNGDTSTCEYRLRYRDGSYINVLDYGQPEWDDQEESVTAVCGAVSVNKAFKDAAEPENTANNP